MDFKDYNLLKINEFSSMSQKSVKEIFNIYLNEYEDRISKIEISLKQGDENDLWEQVHKFKGVLLVFCTEEVVSIAIELDKSLKEKQSDKYEELFYKMKEKSVAAAEQMKKYLKEE